MAARIRSEAEKLDSSPAATNAFAQSLVMDAVMPETVNREANLFLAFGKLDAAMAVTQNALSADPSNKQFRSMTAYLQQLKAKSAAAPAKLSDK